MEEEKEVCSSNMNAQDSCRHRIDLTGRVMGALRRERGGIGERGGLFVH